MNVLIDVNVAHRRDLGATALTRRLQGGLGRLLSDAPDRSPGRDRLDQSLLYFSSDHRHAGGARTSTWVERWLPLQLATVFFESRVRQAITGQTPSQNRSAPVHFFKAPPGRGPGALDRERPEGIAASAGARGDQGDMPQGCGRNPRGDVPSRKQRSPPRGEACLL